MKQSIGTEVSMQCRGSHADLCARRWTTWCGGARATPLLLTGSKQEQAREREGERERERERERGPHLVVEKQRRWRPGRVAAREGVRLCPFSVCVEEERERERESYGDWVIPEWGHSTEQMRAFVGWASGPEGSHPPPASKQARERERAKGEEAGQAGVAQPILFTKPGEWSSTGRREPEPLEVADHDPARASLVTTVRV